MAKLLKKIICRGTLTLKTGLHIGGSDTAMNIGGPDKFVVRNPLNNIPYIPGSSLKGKMRSLIEQRDGTVSERGDVTQDSRTKAGALFGTASNDGGHASRLIVRDAALRLDLSPSFEHTDMPYTESKTEVKINRITGKADKVGPRTIERVPAGAVFGVNMVLNIYESEDEEGQKRTLKDAMEMLEKDYLGGNGSRGYGQVEFSRGLKTLQESTSDGIEIIAYGNQG